MLNFQKIDSWLDQYLDYPGLSPQTLIRKKLTWIWTGSVSFIALLMTLFGFFMGVWILVWYGIVLLGCCAIVMPLLRGARNYELLVLTFLLVVIFTTFIVILMLGGIVHSMGLVFVGLTCAMFSVLLSRRKWTVLVFMFYALTIITAGLLQPYLEIPSENTPSKNLMFHIINILWVSGSTLNLTVVYIKQRGRFELDRSNFLKELNEIKTRLYTNITHEFRTPLTIILGMAKQIKENSKEWLNSGLDLISRNGKNLLILVNKMLDLQQITVGTMRAHPVQSNIIPFLAYITNSFSSLAKAKSIRLNFISKLDLLVMDFDPDKLQKILYNIFSNAIKFTPEGGSIRLVTAFTAKNNKLAGKLLLRVTDTGIGIPKDELPQIFNRFYQVKEETIDHSGGTGVGLAITHELVKLIGGEISVMSKVGKGTSFTLSLPVTNHAPLHELSHGDLTESHLNLVHMPSKVFGLQNNNTAPNDKPIILIIEDNSDMVYYLSICLQEDFNLEFALNGKQGIEKAFEIIPDIVISDIMMPVMSGIELCGKLKNDFRTSHIPIVLLTAKGDIASRIEGLERGADAYLTKPFYKKELIVRLQKLIELREKLKDLYTVNEILSPSGDSTIQQQNKFMQLIQSILEKNISDEGFGVSQLCHELTMSRAQLYRKFEALTNIPIGKFIRLRRLQKAKELLRDTDLNVTEAAFESGFRNLSHFSTAFKEEFGVSPSEIRH